MADLPTLKAGVYRHYKGPLYLVLGYGHDANEEDRDVVVYVGLELDQAKTGPRLAVRTVEDFRFEHMHQTPDGDWIECDSKCPRLQDHIRRFQYLGPTFEWDDVP